MKKLLSMFAAMALVLTLAGCGEKETPDKPVDPVDPSQNVYDGVTAEQLKGVEIEFWHAQSGQPGEAIQELTKRFNETNEWGIKVTSTYQGGYSDTDSKIIASISSGKYPNIGMAYGNNIEGYRESGKVVQINGLIDSTWGMTEEEFNDIVPAFREESAAFPDGKIYSLPIGKSSELLYYNVKFFEDNNLEVPTTWEELVDVATKASAITGKASFGYDSLQNYFITYMQQLGGLYTDEKGDILFREGESYDAAVKVVAEFQKHYNEGIFRLKAQNEYFTEYFQSGQIPMFIGSTSSAGHINADFAWACAPVPAMGELKVMQQGAPVCILDNGTVENVAAYLFVEYLMQAENTAYYAMNSGYVPVRTSSNEVAEYKEFMNNGTPEASVKKAFAEYPGDCFVYDAIFQNSYAYRKLCDKAIERACLEGMDAAESVNKLIADIDAV